MWFILNAPPLQASGGVHWYLGWATLALALVQITGGLLRGSKGGPTDLAKDGSMRGDHFDMTKRRLVFEVVHKGAGYLALVMACLAISSGLWQANAPNWMAVVIALWWISLIVVSSLLQSRGLAFDTYQAIWGPDPDLPGNKRKPIGIGISRKG
jgi:heme A synthase